MRRTEARGLHPVDPQDLFPASLDRASQSGPFLELEPLPVIPCEFEPDGTGGQTFQLKRPGRSI